MNALLKKEIRLMLRGFVLGLGMAMALWLCPHALDRAIWHSPVIYMFLIQVPVLIMAVEAFGNEFTSGTFSMQMAQPVPRGRVWWTKLGTLAVMVIVVWFAWRLAWSLRFPELGSRPLDRSLPIFLFPIVSGGLWSVLLFRQVAIALWLAWLPPVAIWLNILEIFLGTREHARDPHRLILAERAETIALMLYGIAGLWLAWRLFSRAQDTGWTGSEFSLPRMPWLSRVGAAVRRQWRPIPALIAKEIQLLQAQLLVAGGLLILHLATLAVRQYGSFELNSPVKAILEAVWMLWIMVPLMIGCAAVAEERKLGTLDGQLCLPTGHRTQFVVKLAVTLLLSLLLGAVLPVLIEGKQMLGPHFGYPKFGLEIAEEIAIALGGKSSWPFLPILAYFGCIAGLAAIGFYASTLSRGTMQALGYAIPWLLLTCGLLELATFQTEFLNFTFWRGPLGLLIGIPVMGAVLAGLAYRNYKRLRPGMKECWRDLITVAVSLALVVVVTSTTYHRVWELLTPIEPPHGEARLPSNGIRLGVASRYYKSPKEMIGMILPEGKVWFSRYSPIFSNLDGRFLEGNWTTFRWSSNGAVGVQKDGSLWISDPQFTTMIRVGEDADWKCLWSSGWFAILVKANGTLWVWNPWRGEKRVSDSLPHQVGNNSDWAELITYDKLGLQREKPCLKKSDGTYFQLSFTEVFEAGRLTFDFSKAVLTQVSEEEAKRSVPKFTMSTERRYIEAGLDEEGRFVLMRKAEKIQHWESVPVVPEIQIGTESNWVGVAKLDDIFTLRADRTIWRWDYFDFYHASLRDLPHLSPKRLGIRSDWVCISSAREGLISLAADGSLWLWRFEPKSAEQGHPLLQASRRSQYLGNVFSGSSASSEPSLPK